MAHQVTNWAPLTVWPRTYALRVGGFADEMSRSVMCFSR